MKSNVMLKVIFFSMFMIFLIYFVHKKQDTIYIYSPNMHCLGENDKMPWGSLYGCNLVDLFQPYSLKVKTPLNFKKLKNLKKLIIFENPSIKKLKQIKKYHPNKLILFLWEPPSVSMDNYDKKLHKHFSKIYTWDDDLVDNKKYFKFYYPAYQPMQTNIGNFKDKKLCTLIARGNSSSNHPNELFSTRREIIKFFEKNHPTEFDFYGRHWYDNIFPKFKTFKGEIKQAKTPLRNYKFSICYENIKNINGYITEKIFDCFEYGCVPIYLGASNITDYIPANCFIDARNFNNLDDLYTFITSITEEEHNDYIQNIRNYLQSDSAKLFSSDTIAKIMKEAVNV